MKSYKIIQAKDGGFLVIDDGFYRPGELALPVFAGSLDDCLSYIKDKLAKPE